MPESVPDHYALLGLDRRCSATQARQAYWLLSKRHHPDMNPHDTDAGERSRALNAAYETLSDPTRRRAYDRELHVAENGPERNRTGAAQRNLKHEARLRLDELLRGGTFQLRVQDPANLEGPETLELVVPPETAPGATFRLPRTGTFAHGVVVVRVKLQPHPRYRARGHDLRSDLRISAQRAEQGGSEQVPTPRGRMVRVVIPAHIGRGEILRVPGEGLPQANGGKGDLLLRVTYRPEIRLNRR